MPRTARGAGIRALAIAHVAGERSGQPLAFRGLHGPPRKVIEITGMDGVLHLGPPPDTTTEHRA